jgi:hypothetical protein
MVVGLVKQQPKVNGNSMKQLCFIPVFEQEAEVVAV